MNITQVKLTNGSNVYILENVLNSETLAYLHSLADSFSPDNPLWQPAGTADSQPRWVYAVDDASFIPVRESFSSIEHTSYWQERLAVANDKHLFCSNITFFVDLPGCAPLRPHVEGVDSWLSQVYIARESDSYNGTTVYNDAKEVLFQLPYRDNMGWLFDTAGQVMHGREHRVPEGLARFSIMIWYALQTKQSIS